MLLLRRLPHSIRQISTPRCLHSLTRQHKIPPPRLLLLYPRSASLLICHETTTTSSSSNPSLPPYTPPTTGIISKLPSSWVPYAELIRLDKPTGTIYLLLPCLWSTALAATMSTPLTPVLPVLYTSLLFTSGAFLMRGAGCAINDLWDRRIDPLVTRTRHRPLARGALTVPRALTFTATQMLVALGVLVQFPLQVVVAALPSVIVVAAYPGMKRVTDYPQAVLGLAFSWGAMLGFPALGLDLMDPTVMTAAGLLYASGISWTVLYDTVYAHQDIKDDKKAGVRSTAVRHEGQTRRFLSALATVQVAALAGAGVAAGAGPTFFGVAVGGTALGLSHMIRKVDLGSPKDCGEWFRWCAWAVGGGAMLGGLVGEYAVRRVMEDEEVMLKA